MCEGDKRCLHCEQLQLLIAAEHGRCWIEMMGGCVVLRHVAVTDNLVIDKRQRWQNSRTIFDLCESGSF